MSETDSAMLLLGSIGLTTQEKLAASELCAAMAEECYRVGHDILAKHGVVGSMPEVFPAAVATLLRIAEDARVRARRQSP